MSHFSPLRMLISPTLGYQELPSQAFELQDLLPMITTVLSCFKQRRELQSQLSFVLEPNHALIPKFANTLGFLPFHDCESVLTSMRLHIRLSPWKTLTHTNTGLFLIFFTQFKRTIKQKRVVSVCVNLICCIVSCTACH